LQLDRQAIMKKYLGKSGNSGVMGYETAEDRITVQFRNSNVYTYTYRSAGKRHVEKMKLLALSGKGLSGYISQYVREKYEILH
jgi:hypothetical protein